jgi:exodeoxyribonuclease V gamma subunit
MTLHLHRAPRTDQLAEALGELLASPLDDPFAEEVVVVPAKGVERWLTQRLSHRLGVGPRGGDGVCAGVRFLTPSSLVALLVERARDDVWAPDLLVWPLLETIDASLDEPWCAALARHLGHGRTGAAADLRRDRRYSVARRLAGLMSSYAVQRPQLVTDWREGRDTDGAGGDLPADLRWQAELWRRLVARLAADGVVAPDLRHARAVAALETGAAERDLPGRLSLFGHTRLPVSEVALLRALARHRDVHLWLPQPSPALWDELAGLGGVVARADDASAERVGHPLLASLGRDTRELRRVLDGPIDDVASAPPDDAEAGPSTLLGHLQRDLRANRAPSAEERAARSVDPTDRSLQVHACHGQARQVDVLREVLVGLLDDDPTLQPRDILVMCPDIETFAPLISAGFGLADVVADAGGTGGHPAHSLRVRLADRALTSTNPLLAVAATLVELGGGRVTAADLVDLASTPAVRRRFGLGDDDLERVSGWVREAGVRWGLDVVQRRRFEMERFEHNTWRAGIDRILLGVALSGDGHRHVGRGLPLDDVGSSDVDLAGRLAELVDRVARCLTALESAVDVADWMSALTAGVRGLTDVGPDDAWQVPQLERELARAAGDGNPGVPLRLADVRAMLASRLGGRPTRSNFRTGTLTVCTMVPMRSVPHRVVCLVGLDDGVFPRLVVPDGDDVLARDPLTGERDVRSEDRQLLLDAVLAATDRVVITYTGASEQSGSERPPAVPLGEILDAADRTLAEPVRDRVLVRHPLQPYDARNFRPDLVDPARPFSFDGAALAGARASARPRTPAPPLVTGPLPPRPAGDVSLADLRAFLVHPVRGFVRGRLDVSVPFSPDELGDAIPIELDALESWAIGDRLLREAVLAGDGTDGLGAEDAMDAAMTAELLRGTLPPAKLGRGTLDRVAAECRKLLTSTADLRAGRSRSVDVDVDLGDGRRLTGTVAGVHGGRLVDLGYSRLKPKQRLATWIDLLALSASRPDESFTSHAIGRQKAGPRRALAGPVDHRAVEWLRTLVELRDTGLRSPLPVPVATAAAWAEGHARVLKGDDVDPVELARREWTTDPFNAFGITGEDADPYHRRAYGDDAPVEALLDLGLETYAWQVWEPLLSGAEKVGPL